MSGQAVPITMAAFREALKSLTTQSLYLKVDELRNNIAHLDDSNQQLRTFSQGMLRGDQRSDAGEDQLQILESDDQECIHAIQENEVVIKRFQDRINLLAAEIEERGLRFQNTAAATATTSPSTASITRISSKEVCQRSLSTLTNKDLYQTRINGLLRDQNLALDLHDTVNEKTPINPSNYQDFEATEFMTNEPSVTGSQYENKVNQETFVANVNKEEGLFL